MLKTPIDLDTGRVLAIDDLLTERYFQNLRNYGYRENTAGELDCGHRGDARGIAKRVE
jgi:hypothetical protein